MHRIPSICIILGLSHLIVSAQHPLFIPPLMNGPVFNLDVQNGTKNFWPGITTPTYGINGPFLGPTLVFQQGDSVTLNVTNHLTGTGNTTTMHWHGIHLPPEADGGPHQPILQNTTWSPSFRVLNTAGTFWYHPHGKGRTDMQVSKGLAGMILVKDSAEAQLTLPRTYGTDDFPIILQTRSFDILNQIATSTAFDTLPMVNGTVQPFLAVPSQVVRLRLLNGSSERTFQIGFSNQMPFRLIAIDGGLLDSAIQMHRIRLANGERAEILLDLQGMNGDTIRLMSFGSELPHGIMGSDSVGGTQDSIPGYYQNPLNGADYSLLELRISSQTPGAVTTLPNHLVSHNRWSAQQANRNRQFVLDTLSEMMTQPGPATGPFGINRRFFDMDSINERVRLGDIEIWTLHNRTLVAHPFHIHDIQFYLLDVNGGPVPPEQSGKKDVVLVMPGDSVRIITRFLDYADDSVPYMYHCHILHHEDDGMMGSFLVVDTVPVFRDRDRKTAPLNAFIWPNPGTEHWMFRAGFTGETDMKLISTEGKILLNAHHSFTESGTEIRIPCQGLARGMYFLQVQNGDRQEVWKLVKE